MSSWVSGWLAGEGARSMSLVLCYGLQKSLCRLLRRHLCFTVFSRLLPSVSTPVSRALLWCWCCSAPLMLPALCCWCSAPLVLLVLRCCWCWSAPLVLVLLRWCCSAPLVLLSSHHSRLCASLLFSQPPCNCCVTALLDWPLPTDDPEHQSPHHPDCQSKSPPALPEADR